MKFNSNFYPYPSCRKVVYAKNGMVCASQSLSAQAGLKVLQNGGNAIDAALATAICETALEPTGNGIGSDMFALVWFEGKLHGLNASGSAPEKISAQQFIDQGLKNIPERGWDSVTIPGAVAGWVELHKKFGKLPFAELFKDAISYAEKGYPLSPTVSTLWNKAKMTFEKYKGQVAFEGFFKTFFKDGEAPADGQLVTLPGHAKTLKAIAESYGKSFYNGEIAQAIVDFSDRTGGYITAKDLREYKPLWGEPLSTEYRGYDVWELPPNGHGLIVLLALNILKEYEFQARESLDTLHRQMEAMKLAFSDGLNFIADEKYMKTNVKTLLSSAYAEMRRKEIGDKAVFPKPGDPYSGGTVYLCAADGDGNMVSYIQSNYMGFGSGIVVPDYGIAFNNRGHGFSLDPNSDNFLEAGKRPYNTIIPGFLTKNGKPVGPFGVMGGFMQPQGHVQVVMNMLDFGLNPQSALDAPRWQWISGNKFEVEKGFPEEIIEQLRDKGHDIIVNESELSFGRGQIIINGDNGVYAGGSEPRADGLCAAW